MCVFLTLNSIISFQVISCHSSHGLYAEMTLKITSHQNISAQNETFWWLISHWAKSVNNPFPPTIFYDTLTAIILTFYSTFHNKNDIFGWVCPVKLKCGLLAKQNKIGSIYKNYSLVLSRVGKAPGYLYWDHGGSLCTDIKIFQIFLKKKYMLFSFEACIPKTVFS